jgi:hypothetical protein
MAESPERVGFFVWLFGFGTDLAARKAIDVRLARITETTERIREDHSLDKLVSDIEDISANGVAAMGDGSG